MFLFFVLRVFEERVFFLLAHKRARGRIGVYPAVLHMQVNA